MRIAISSYSFHGLLDEGRMDVFGFLESCKYRYGVEAVEIWNGTLGRNTDEGFLRQVRRSLDDRELTLANLCVDGPHLWEDDPEKREKNYRSALEYLRAAEILGAKALRIDMGGAGNELTAEQLDYVAKRYREYAERAGDGGFRVGPETHWGPSLTPAVQQRVHDAVDHPAYGILLHVGHWEGGPEQEAFGDRMAAAWTAHTHIDARITASCLEEKVRMLLSAGYAGYLGVEAHTGKNEYWEAGWQLAELRRVVARLRAEAEAEAEGAS